MLALQRILDANLNRAREAIRVLEDLARFALDDAELASRLKTLRHDLVTLLEQAIRHEQSPGVAPEAPLALDAASLLTARDTPGDVGTTITGSREFVRTELVDLAAANGSRLTEALRSIEEAAKGLSAASLASGIEQLRYRAYDIDRDLRIALTPSRASQWRVCVLISESLCEHHPWIHVAEQAILGGMGCLQLREKALDGAEFLRRARQLVQLAAKLHRDHPARPRCDIIINDRPDIALLSGAQGVHLGQDDLPVREARALGGSRLLIGVSCSTFEHAQAACRDGADYLGLGPMFESITKPKPALSGPALVRAVTEHIATSTKPHLAISGITPANLPELVRAGCRGVAVSSFVCGSRDPASACRSLLQAFPDSARASDPPMPARAL